MDKNNAGVYGQRNYNDMGDGHARGHQSIQKEGTYGNPKNDKWKEYVLQDPGNGKPTPPTNNKLQPDKRKELWKEKVLAAKPTFEKPKSPTPQIKQIEKPKPVMTKSR